MDCTLTHAAVYVSDLERARAFYTRYFGAASGARYENANGFSSFFLRFCGGARLELMHRDGLVPAAGGQCLGWHHIALSVGDKQQVQRLTAELAEAGYEVYSPPRTTGDGYFESCVADPDGNRVEITARHSTDEYPR